MGSHSVTCYPTQVNTPRLNPSHACRYSIYVPRRDGRLSWPSWLDSAPAGSRTSDLSITSPTPNHCTMHHGSSYVIYFSKPRVSGYMAWLQGPCHPWTLELWGYSSQKIGPVWPRRRRQGGSRVATSHPWRWGRDSRRLKPCPHCRSDIETLQNIERGAWDHATRTWH